MIKGEAARAARAEGGEGKAVKDGEGKATHPVGRGDNLARHALLWLNKSEDEGWAAA